MKIPTIDGCLAKLARAKLHRDGLERELLTELPKQQVALIATKDESEAGQYTLRAGKLRPDLDTLAGWGAWIGDAVHDLRSPLDHLAVAIVRKHVQPPPDHMHWVTFPIEFSPAEFREHYTVKHLDPTLRDWFEFYQPYKDVQPPPGATGKALHPLRLLKKLSNRDKHNVITPLISWTEVLAVSLDPLGPGTVITGLTPPGPLQEGAPIVDVLAPNAPVGMTEVEVGYLTPSITLRGGLEVINALDGMYGVVAQVIEEAGPLL